jgi:hypothetical protein
MKKKGMSALFSGMVILILSLAFMFVVVSFVIPYFQTIQDMKIQNNSVEHLRLINSTINEIKDYEIDSYKILNVSPLSNIYIDAEKKEIFVEQYINNKQFYDSYREGTIGNIQVKKERQHFIYVLDIEDIDIDVDVVISTGKQELIFMVVDYDDRPLITIRPHHEVIDREPPLISVFASDDNHEEYYFNEWISSDFINIDLNISDQSNTTIYYCLDENNECEPNLVYVDDINITTPGYYYFKYYAVDSWTNQTPIYTKEVKIERCLFPTSGTWTVDGREVCGNREIDVPEFIYVQNNNELLFYDCNINLNTSASTSVVRVYDQAILKMKGGLIRGTVSGHYPYIYLYGGSAHFENTETISTNPGIIRIRVNEGASAELDNTDFFYAYFYGDINIKNSKTTYSYIFGNSKINVENSEMYRIYLYVQSGHTMDINNFDYTTTRDYRFLSDNGIDINLTNVDITTFYLTNSGGNVNVYNSNIYGFTFYNYNDKTSIIENTDMVYFNYKAYGGTEILFEDWTYPVTNLSKTIITPGNNVLELNNVSYNYLYSYSGSSSNVTYKNNSIYVLYLLSNSTNLLENMTINYLIYAYGNSRNTIKDSTIETFYLNQFYQTSETTFYNTKILPASSRYTKLYNTAKMHFMDSNCVLDKLYLNAGTHNPTISGYVNITSLSLWGAGNVLNRYLPFIAKYEENYYAPDVNISIKDGATLIDSGITDVNGFVELLISADNSANPDKTYDVYANDEFIRTVTILEDSSNGVEVLVPEPGLIGHWMFDEGEGTTVVDSSVNDNNGTIVGGVTWVEGYGRGDYSLEFDGTTGYIDLNESTTIESISLWANFNNVTSTGYFLGGSGQGIRYNGSEFLTYNGGSNWTTVPWDKKDEWVHFVVVKISDREYDIYINNEHIGTSYSGDGTPEISINLIGKRQGGLFFNGLLDDIRIYDTNLSLQNISNLYNATKDNYINLEEGLVSYWNFDDIEGDVIDSHGDYNGTNTGATRGVDGIINNAFEFNGVNNYVKAAIGQEIISTNQKNTVLFWAKINDLEKISQAYISQGDWQIGMWYNHNNNKDIRYHTNNFQDQLQYITWDWPSPDNEWHLVGGFYDGTNVGVIFDGEIVLVGEGSTSGNDRDPFTTLQIAFKENIENNDFLYDGLIDELGIWNRVLSPIEIEEIYNNGIGLTYPFN